MEDVDICIYHFQLSQKYKSSADLVSELLKKPVFTRYRSMKKKSVSCSGPRTKSGGGMPTHHEDQSADLVRRSDVNQRSDADSEALPPDPVEVTRVQMRLPVTMRPRLATLNSDTDEVSSLGNSEVTEVGGWEVRSETGGQGGQLTPSLNPGDNVDGGDTGTDGNTVSVVTSNKTNTTGDKSSVSINTVSCMPAKIDLSVFINRGVICLVNNILIKLVTKNYA